MSPQKLSPYLSCSVEVGHQVDVEQVVNDLVGRHADWAGDFRLLLNVEMKVPADQ